MNIELLGAAAIVVTLLGLGVQIIFYTKSFGEEYEKKRDAIREVKNTFLVDEIGKLIKMLKDKGSTKLTESDKQIILDEGAPIRQFETLASIRRMAMDVEEWVGIVEYGKALIRKLGLTLIGNGVIVAIIFSFLILDNVLIASLICIYILGPFLFLLIYFAVGFTLILKKIDIEYISVMQRKTGISGGA